MATVAIPSKWGYNRKDSRRGVAGTVSKWLSAIDGLEAVCQRLKQIQLEHGDFSSVCKRFDTKHTLFYLDPPYVPETRSGGVCYHHEMTLEQHRVLLIGIKQLTGKVILSGYANSLYEHELADWRCYPQAQKNSPATGQKSTRQEIIWSNYHLPCFDDRK
jgi:DNA adenine methylase